MVREIFLLGSLDLGGAVTALAFWQLHGVKIKKFVADLGPKSAKVVKDNAAVIASFIVGTLGGETAATDKLPNNEQDNRKEAKRELSRHSSLRCSMASEQRRGEDRRSLRKIRRGLFGG
ncbi:MAG: hypothetical protein U0517_01725 [Candidatus Andersenbacteria bacterium]